MAARVALRAWWSGAWARLGSSRQATGGGADQVAAQAQAKAKAAAFDYESELAQRGFDEFAEIMRREGEKIGLGTRARGAEEPATAGARGRLMPCA